VLVSIESGETTVIVTNEAVARGEIPCIRIGRRILVPIAGLMRLLESAGTATREP